MAELAERRNIGRKRRALAAGICEDAQLSRLHMGQRGADGKVSEVHLSGHEVGDGLRRTTIGHVLHIEPQLLLEQLEAQLLQRSDAGRRIIVVPGPGLDGGNQLVERVDRHDRRIDHEADAACRQRGDRREARDRIVAQVLDQGLVDRERRAGGHQHVAIGRGGSDHFRAEGAAGARLVVNHDRLAVALGDLLCRGAGDQIECGARRERNHDRDAARGIALRRDRRRRERKDEHGAGHPVDDCVGHLVSIQWRIRLPRRPARNASRRFADFPRRANVSFQRA